MHTFVHTIHDTAMQLRSQCINDAEMRQDLMQAVHVDDSHGLPYPKVLELQTARTADAQGTGVGSCCLAWPSEQPGRS